MRTNKFREVVILSAELSDKTSDYNKRQTSNLETCLDELGIVYNSAIGVYKGSVETSFVCLPKNDDEYMALHDLALRQFKQESILWQAKSGKSYLVPSTGNLIELGELRRVPKVIAQLQDSYTLLNDKYYAVL